MKARLALKFNRPLTEFDYISPGSYTAVLNNGERKQFDFCESECNISDEDPCVYECVFRELDRTYEDGGKFNIYDVFNITRFEEIFVGISYDNYESNNYELLTTPEVLYFTFSDYIIKDSGTYVDAEIPEHVLKKSIVAIDDCI